MQDEQLIAVLMSASDTLSRGGAEQAIRIVREHDRRVTVERAWGDLPLTPEQRRRAREIADREDAHEAFYTRYGGNG